MHDRHGKLLRLAELFDLAKRLAEVRVARLLADEAVLAEREKDILTSLGNAVPQGLALQDLGRRRLSAIAVERAELRRRIEVETVERQTAERRSRALARAITRQDAAIESQASRRFLEELRSGGAPSSGPGKF
ncbi:MAG: hypothetical protein ACK5JM_03530 [Rhodoblastus sp.]